jgi:uncharacterized protein
VANSPATAAYIDSSAIVKLVLAERESAALLRRVETLDLVSSEIAFVEVLRAIRLETDSTAVLERAEDRLSGIDFVVIDQDLLQIAARADPRELRTLDAVHLASASRVREGIGSFLVYDRRLARAAQDAGLPVESPGASQRRT